MVTNDTKMSWNWARRRERKAQMYILVKYRQLHSFVLNTRKDRFFQTKDMWPPKRESSFSQLVSYRQSKWLKKSFHFKLVHNLCDDVLYGVTNQCYKHFTANQCICICVWVDNMTPNQLPNHLKQYLLLDHWNLIHWSTHWVSWDFHSL